MAVQTQIQARRGTAATWTSTNPTLAAGEMGFETDTGKFKIGTGSAAWTALGYAGGGQNTLSTYVYTATSGQTTFSGADSNGNTLSYTVGAIQVYLNGALLTPTSDFTASTGTSVVLVTGALTSDTLTVLALGSFTVSTDIAKSTLSTKGDILTATAASTPAVLAVGSDGSSIVADSSTSTGLRYIGNYAAGKNAIINGAFNVWQRGTSFTLANGTWTYGADRFQAICNFSAGSAVYSQQTFTPGTAPVAGYEGSYYARLVSASTITNAMISQRIENVRTYAGQTVTFSFWVKGSSAITPTIYFSQNFGSGGSAGVDTTTTFTTTTGWTRVSATVAIPSITGKTIGTSSYLDILIYHTTASFTLETWGWQVEAGSVATAFQTATGTLQGELAACQRYYERLGGQVSGANFPYANAAATGNQYLTIGYKYSTDKRVAPTITKVGTWSVTNCAQPYAEVIQTNAFALTTLVTAAGGYAYNPTGTTQYLEISAEL